MTRIIIVDDHTIVRRGLKQILAGTSDMIVTGEAGSAEELLEKLEESTYDVLILDISLPGKSGLDVLPHVKLNFPSLQVLILSMHPEEAFAVESIRKGASGYLTKESAPEELLEAVRYVMQGKKYISPVLAQKLAADSGLGSEGPRHLNLSEREFQIMKKIAVGQSPSQIAAELKLSPKTVNSYRANILKKMNIKTNAELTIYAVKHGLI